MTIYLSICAGDIRLNMFVHLPAKSKPLNNAVHLITAGTMIDILQDTGNIRITLTVYSPSAMN